MAVIYNPGSNRYMPSRPRRNTTRRIVTPDPAPNVPRPDRAPPNPRAGSNLGPVQVLLPQGPPQFGPAPPPPPKPNTTPVAPATPPVTNEPVAPAPIDFNKWKYTQPGYVAQSGALSEQRRLLLELLGNASDPSTSLTTYGKLNKQYDQDLYGSRQGAANAGFYGGGALQALKSGNYRDLIDRRTAAESDTKSQTNAIDTQLSTLDSEFLDRYNQWLKDNPPAGTTVDTTPGPDTVPSPPANPDQPKTPQEAQHVHQWDENAEQLYGKLTSKLTKQPLEVVRGLTKYLAENGKYLSTTRRRQLEELRTHAYKRYYQMTRG